MSNADPLGLAAAREREQLILSAYETTDPKRIKVVALLEYRCRHGCLLLHVWRSPDGVLFYRPAYKLSPRFNAERSNAAGRARNTRDGGNHWNPVAGLLDDLRGWGPSAGLDLQCDHVDQTLPASDLLEEADAATPGRPTRRLI